MSDGPIASKIASCANCAFKRHDVGNVQYIRCHRYPPQMIQLPMAPKIAGGAPGFMERSSFTITNPNNWCGEWKEKKDEEYINLSEASTTN